MILIKIVTMARSRCVIWKKALGCCLFAIYSIIFQDILSLVFIHDIRYVNKSLTFLTKI